MFVLLVTVTPWTHIPSQAFNLNPSAIAYNTLIYSAALDTGVKCSRGSLSAPSKYYESKAQSTYQIKVLPCCTPQQSKFFREVNCLLFLFLLFTDFCLGFSSRGSLWYSLVSQLSGYWLGVIKHKQVQERTDNLFCRPVSGRLSRKHSEDEVIVEKLN